jgi:hypothetical protein
MAQVRQAEFETCGSITKWSKRRDEAFRWAHWHNPPTKQPSAAPFNVSWTPLQMMAKVDNRIFVYRNFVRRFLGPRHDQALLYHSTSLARGV